MHIPIHTFFSAVHRTFSKTDHISGHKASLNTFLNEIISYILSDYNGIKLEINNRNYTNAQVLTTAVLNNQWVMKEKKRVNKNILQLNKNENTTYQNLWTTVKTVLKMEAFIGKSAYI
jgi:hypothetical protein